MLLKTDLSGQKLLQVPAQLAPDLAWLVLDNNQIVQIGNYSLPSKLIHLSIEGNQLLSIHSAELE